MLTKYLYLGVALALAAVLSFTHLTAYRAGKANVRAEWTESVAQANKDARALEQQRQRRADEAAQLAAADARADADRRRRADRAASGLRNALDAAERRAIESDDAAAVYRAALRTVFESCTAEYRAVGEDAAGHARDSLMYQRSWPK